MGKFRGIQETQWRSKTVDLAVTRISTVRKTLATIAAILALPALFVIKDIVATMAILSTEPGITSKAALYYRVAMLPGTLWFGGAAATLFNVIFGLIVGTVLYLSVRQKKLWLVGLPALALFLKDVIATAVLVLRAAPESTAKPSLSYAIALLPGSALEKFGDPIVFNLVIGIVLGLLLYLLALRRRAVS